MHYEIAIGVPPSVSNENDIFSMPLLGQKKVPLILLAPLPAVVFLTVSSGGFVL